MISAIVLVGPDSDQKLLKKCLDSLAWCSETVKVETKNLKGSFSDWRNEGLKRAKGKWVLYLDTDEVITKELKNEILLITNHQSLVTCFAIPRRNFIFGKEFKHSGQYPDYQKRLFLKSALIKWTGEVHEEPKFDGKLGHLKNPILHYKNMTLTQMVDKTNKWSEIEAKLMFEAGHPKMNFLRFTSAAFREFWLRMIVQVAFLDGKEGVIYALYQVYSRLISYSKLWEMQQ